MKDPQQEKKHMLRMTIVLLTLGVVLVGTQAPAGAQEAWPAGVGFRVASGEIREGDTYVLGEQVEIDGRLAGDLFGFGRRVRVDGQVDGDLFAAAQFVDIGGTVGDSARVAAERLAMDGTIDGDLLVAAEEIRLERKAQVTRNVRAAGSRVEINGTVDGDLTVFAGEVVIGGTVRGNASLHGDRVSLDPSASIEGDLTYTSRVPLRQEEIARVAGTARAAERAEEEEEEDAGGITTGSVIFWAWQVSAALLMGTLIIALLRGVLLLVASAIPEKATVGTLLGFGAFLIIPIASVVSMVTLIGLPVGLATFLLYWVVLYVAKIPVAVWAGGRLLTWAGRPDASPYLALLIGVVLLYLLFQTPYVGWLIWFVATWLGLGTMVLTGFGYLQTRAEGT